MKKLLQRVSAYLYNVDIEINERLGAYFVNIGIVAAILGVVVCLLSHIPVSGTIATALIAVTAPLIASLSRHTHHSERYGALIGVLIIFMIPIVWLTTGAESSGSGYWFMYELFYISLFTNRKQMVPFLLGAVLVIAAAIALDYLHPELFFHFTSRRDAFVSKLGSGSVVTAEILITVLVQKSLYTYERELNTKAQDQTRSFVTSISNTIDTKDPYTGGHSRRVAECSAALALRLGMSQAEADNIYFVALLHDIGKIGVPDRVLNKPGRLTREETALIRKHPVYGAEILKDVSMLPHIREGVLYHHEHYDGTGYPEGLKGEEIPYVARIIAVADSYDAMSTSRVYRKFIPRDEIINEFLRCRGTQFDPHITDVFVRMLMDGFRIEHPQVNNIVNMDDNMEVAASMMMRRIVEDTQLLKQKNGSLDVDNEEFNSLYTYLLSLSRRFGIELNLITITLNFPEGNPEQDRLLACIAELNEAITQSIRAVDICTRYGSASYLLLLLNARVPNIGLIFDRISDGFYQLHGSRDVTLSHSIIDPDQKSEQSRLSAQAQTAAEDSSEAPKQS